MTRRWLRILVLVALLVDQFAHNGGGPADTRTILLLGVFWFVANYPKDDPR